MLRPRTLVLVGSALLLVAAGFAAVADDQGAAAVGVLSLAVVLLLSGAAASGPLHPRSAAVDMTAARERAIGRSRELIAGRVQQVPHASALAPLTIAGLDRVHGRDAAPVADDPAGAFDAAAGRLVLVGEPGAGKSTVLVQLCQALLARTDGDAEAPIPVLLSLTTWKEPQPRRWPRRRRSGDPLTTWFVEQSALVLGIPARDIWALMPWLVPVLDGLDEVASDLRRSVSVAIEQAALRAPRQKLVVACREREFAALTAPGADALPAFQLEPLSRPSLIRFFTTLDADHWQPVVESIRDEASPLGPALSTPLMLTVAIQAWGTSDPAPQIPSPDDTVEHARAQLWDLWVDRAARQAGSDAFALAVGLARAADASGRSEIRFEELGDAHTRRAWWITKTALGVALAAAAPLFFLAAWPLMLNVANATGIAFARITGRWLGRGSPRLERGLRAIAIATVAPATVAMSFAAALLLPLPIVVPIMIGAAIASGALVAWANPLPDGGSWLRRRQPDPFVRARVHTQVLLGCFALLAAVQVAREDITFGIAAAAVLMLLYPATDGAAHHWIARCWYRVQSGGGPLPQRVDDLVDAGFLRPTSDAWRFFHLELQNHLANRPAPSSSHRLEHRELTALYTAIAIAQVYRRELDAAEEAFRNAIVTRPGSALRLYNYALFLSRERHDPDRAEWFYRRALVIAPKHVLSLVALARLLEAKSGDRRQIEDLYERAVAAAPNATVALSLYAQFLGDDPSQEERADQLHRRAIASTPNDVNALFAYADFRHVVQAKYAKALVLYRRAHRLAPDRPGIAAQYAAVLDHLGLEPDHARRLHRQAVDAEPTAYRLANFARHCAAQRQWPEMGRSSRRALRIASSSEKPEALECWFYLWAGGDPDARAHVQELLDAGVRSPGWPLDMVVEAAASDGHPEVDDLAETARRIAEPVMPSTADVDASPAAAG